MLRENTQGLPGAQWLTLCSHCQEPGLISSWGTRSHVVTKTLHPTIEDPACCNKVGATK